MTHLPLPKSLLAMASAAVLLAACGKPPAGGPPPSLAVPQVGVVTVQARALPITRELPGRTAAKMVSEVRPQVTGIVQRRSFTEGSLVKAGEVLYQIDPATYQAAVASAQAALERSEATLATAQLKAGRYQELVKIKAVSQQDADDAFAARRQAQADVNSARAALTTAKISLDYTRVTAPIAGRVGRSTVSPGALVTANQATALATVQQLDPIYVDVTQSSAALLQLKRALEAGQLKQAGANGAKVELLLEDGSRYAQTGTLRFSEVSVDEGTGAVTLRAEFPNPKGELLPGMYVRAVIQQAVAEDAIAVPQRAIVRDNKGQPTAYVVTADNKIELRVLQTGQTMGDQWLVSAGLKAGDRLVIDGLQKVRPGQTVEVLPASAGPTPPKAAPSAPAEH
ncbi:efflux RND transporter periplasmic adaptor subunit [Ideonella sp. B7]|uniref:efflux RND transporter periplasmic adaptor subunit n=1 Tax=Ideonella benzenivorans TaxID=2831643 RepID=UPI001CECB2CF|nr:efflux RND transporter periplasmic adaptor subunit [Ideonella benzenivorans]MCA6218046.1 efflux RND transporter periplasmic adaptor subunit [Ideonella benzenivorans]